jgi:small-conductance mechanosensitive channel
MIVWLIAAGIAAAVGIALWIARMGIGRRLAASAERSARRLDRLAADLVRRTRGWFIAVVALYAGSAVFILGPGPARLRGAVVGPAVLFQIAVWGNAVISVVVGEYVWRGMDQDASTATTADAVSFLARLILWTVAFLLILDNRGVNVTTLVAGLGVGGIAIALALQGVLGDVFAAFSIVLDKPFRLYLERPSRRPGAVPTGERGR